MTRLNEILTGAADSLRRKSFSRSNSNQGAAAQAAGPPQTPQSPQTPSAPQRFLSVPGQQGCERRHSSSDPGMGVVAETQGSEWWTMTILAGSSEIMQRHSSQRTVMNIPSTAADNTVST